jgi:hypothetical protein
MGLALHTKHVCRSVDGVVQREGDELRLRSTWLEWQCCSLRQGRMRSDLLEKRADGGKHRLRVKIEEVGVVDV